MQSVFISKILRIGTSEGIVLPRNILNALKWERGDFVVFGFAGNEQIFIKRMTDEDMRKLKPSNFIN
jgi:antitoxin component of MazEF toxin-antitoxin module